MTKSYTSRFESSCLNNMDKMIVFEQILMNTVLYFLYNPSVGFLVYWFNRSLVFLRYFCSFVACSVCFFFLFLSPKFSLFNTLSFMSMLFFFGSFQPVIEISSRALWSFQLDTLIRNYIISTYYFSSLYKILHSR